MAEQEKEKKPVATYILTSKRVVTRKVDNRPCIAIAHYTVWKEETIEKSFTYISERLLSKFMPLTLLFVVAHMIS